jgi:FkbM family methyltransferase
MTSARFLWSGYGAIVRSIRRNALAYWLARQLPKAWRAAVRGGIENGLRKLTPLGRDNTCEVHGHKLYLDPLMESKHLYATGIYEPDVVRSLESHIKPGAFVIDLGAHVGFYTLLTAGLVGPRGRVYAFEPQVEVRRVLARNVALNGYESRCRVLPYAVADTTSSRTLFVRSQQSDQSSLFAGANVSEKAIVETVSLDEFFAAEGWPSVDFVKIDVEGAERLVLEGMRELSARNPQLKLVMEYGTDLARRARYSGQELANVLLELGFRTGYPLETSRRSFRLEDGWPTTVYDNFLLTKDESRFRL